MKAFRYVIGFRTYGWFKRQIPPHAFTIKNITLEYDQLSTVLLNMSEHSVTIK